MSKFHKLLSVIILIFFPASELFSAEDYYKGFTITVSAGPSYVTGFYEKYLKTGNNVEVGTFYNLPYLDGNTYFTGGISYYSYRMEASSKSFLRQTDLYAGTMYAYPLLPFMFINAGFSVMGIYSKLDTYNTDRHETTFKPGYSASLGGMAYLGRGVGLYLNSEYRITEISSEEFNSLTFRGGITCNFSDYRSDIEDRLNTGKKIALFNKGNNEFRRKNFNEAKKIFSELYSMDRSYPGLEYYMKRIEEIEHNYKTAEKFINQKNYLKAIPYLTSCSPYIKECELKLLQQRKNLMPDVEKWEKEGIQLYDIKRYGDCINVMEKILLVDPENKNANIYLPRAIKRQRAIESLQGK